VVAARSTAPPRGVVLQPHRARRAWIATMGDHHGVSGARGPGSRHFQRTIDKTAPLNEVLMRRTLKSATLVLTRLGQCPYCIRKALLATASAWLLTSVLAVTGHSVLFTLAAAVAGAPTALWLAHLLAFAQKSVNASHYPTVRLTGRSRRSVWPLFIRAAVFAAFASALPRVALAASPCGGTAAEPCPDRCQRRLDPETHLCIFCRSCGNDCGQEPQAGRRFRLTVRAGTFGGLAAFTVVRCGNSAGLSPWYLMMSELILSIGLI
jgi:hypothetical protein